MQIERPYRTCYLMAIVVFTISITISKIFSRNCAWPWPCPLEYVKVKCKYANQKSMHDLYLIAIVIFTLSLTISKIFAVKMFMTLIITLKWVKFKCKYANWRPIHDLLIDRNSNFYHIYHHFQDIHYSRVHERDLDF